jgi:hypothetical protein
MPNILIKSSNSVDFFSITLNISILAALKRSGRIELVHVDTKGRGTALPQKLAPRARVCFVYDIDMYLNSKMKMHTICSNREIPG